MDRELEGKGRRALEGKKGRIAAPEMAFLN